MATFGGTEADDTIDGSFDADLIFGLGGNDSLNGSGGHDSIDGGDGADQLYGFSGNDTLVGGAHNDALFGEAGMDSLLGGAGYDILHGGKDNDWLDAGDEGGSLHGEGGDDTLLGGADADELSGGNGADYLSGKGGNDSLAAGGSDTTETADTLLGGAGNDSLTDDFGADYLAGGPGNDTLSGGYAADTLLGGGGNDLLKIYRDVTARGGEGNDTLEVYEGGGSIDAGAGSDAISVSLVAYLEGVFTTVPAITVSGGSESDVFRLGSVGGVYSLPKPEYMGEPTITDFIAGSGGDRLDIWTLLTWSAENGGYVGGEPLDAVQGYFALLQSGSDTLLQWDRDGAAGSTYVAQSVARLQGVESGDITAANFTGRFIVGTSNADSLEGGFGNDTLSGLGGDDTLDGGAGSDSMDGGAGNDRYYVDDSGDLVVETSNGLPVAAALDGFIDTVIATIDYSLEAVANVENLTLAGAALQATGNALGNAITGNVGGNTLSGLDGADRIGGGAAADTLYGGSGNDTLDGGSGVDSMLGGAGNDRYVISTLADAVVELSGEGTDTAAALVSDYVLPAQVENLVLLGSVVRGTGNASSNLLTGNAANNVLVGGAGADTLRGSAGADRLVGGGGADNLSGGDGNDTLVADANDVVAGGAGMDRLQLTGSQVLDFTALPAGRVSGIEKLDLAGANTVTLDASAVLAMSPTDSLVINGDTLDTVRLAGAWSGPSLGAQYQSYTSGAAVLDIGLDVAVQFL